MEGRRRNKKKIRKVEHEWDKGWHPGEKILAIKREVDKRRDKMGIISTDNYWANNFSIFDARDALKRGLGINKDIKSMVDLANVLDELSPEEREEFFWEMARITGEKDYQQTSTKTRRLVKALLDKAKNPVVIDIGTAKGKYVTQLIKKSKPSKKIRLIQTNLSAIEEEKVRYPSDHVSEREYLTNVHVSEIHKHITDITPHIIIVKDVLKFLYPEEVDRALKSLSKVAKEGTVLLIGNELPQEVENEPGGHIIEEGISKLHTYVKVNGKLHRVHTDRLISLLRRAKDWEEYKKKLKEELDRLKLNN